MINYAAIKTFDVANGPGIRVSLFVSGCTHHCEGCFNEEAWSFSYGEPFTEEVENQIITALSPSHVKGLTLLGGEPFEYVNQKGLLPFLRRVRKLLPEKDIWCFTGYLFDTQILDDMCKKWEETKEMVSLIDVIVDGRFEQDKKDISLRFRGSSNQRIIDVKSSLSSGKVVWQEEFR